MELFSQDLNDFLYAGIDIEEMINVNRFINWVLKEVYEFDIYEQDDYWEMAIDNFKNDLCYCHSKGDTTITDVFVCQHFYALKGLLIGKLGLDDDDVDYNVGSKLTFTVRDRELFEEFKNLNRKAVD